MVATSIRDRVKQKAKAMTAKKIIFQKRDMILQEIWEK